MKTRPLMSVSNIIRLLFFPTILLLTILAGIRVRHDLNNIITHGFDKKLSAVSSTTGAFVDLEDHKLIFTPRTITSLDIESNGEIVAVTRDSDITRLSTDGSASLSPLFRIGFPSRQLAISDETIYVSDSAGTSVYRYSLEGVLEMEPDLDGFAFTALTYHDSLQSLFLASVDGELLQVTRDNDLAGPSPTGIANVVDITESPDGGLSLLTSDQYIYHIGAGAADAGMPTGEIYAAHAVISDTTGSTVPGESSRTILTCSPADDPDASCPLIENLAYDASEGHYWSAGERLYRILGDGTIDLDYDTYPGYYDHWSTYYLKYSGAMRNILIDLNLTYLYSFALFPEDGSIAYVLDGSVGEDYTHIGYMDFGLPPADFDQATFVLRTGRNHVSDIQPWGQWGLLKYGFAPLYDSELHAEAVMGADLNVSAINQVTREAMVILSLSTFFFLILSGFAAWYISRPLTAPLVRLKENVLHIAAGFFDRPIDTPPLKDLRPLAGLFNETGDKLNHEIYDSLSAKQKFEQNRRFYELLTIFKDQTSGFQTYGIELVISNRPADSSGLIGACHSEGFIAVWRLTQPDAYRENLPLETIRRHRELKVLVESLSAQTGATAITVLDKTEAILGELTDSLFLWHKDEQSFVYRTDKEEILRLRTEAGPEEKIIAGTGSAPVTPEICSGWKLHLTDEDGTSLTMEKTEGETA